MISNIAVSDIDMILKECVNFFNESRYAKMAQFKPEKVRDTITSVLRHPRGIGFVHREKRAFFLGMVDEHYFADIKYAYDLFVYVPPEHRGLGVGYRLLKKYVERAEELGADEIYLGDIADIDQETLFRIHEKLGLSYRSKVYSKVIGE